MQRPLCFVLMPFDKRRATGERLIERDAVYRDIIAPAVHDAGLEALRADADMSAGVTHTSMFEQLILCEYAVVDVSSASADVCYQLGLRRALRPAGTALLYAATTASFACDAAAADALRYRLGDDGVPFEPEPVRRALAERLRAARNRPASSPLVRIVDDFPGIQRLKTDVFRDRVDYPEQQKAALASARQQGLQALRAVEASLGHIASADSAVVVDLLLSYRAVKGWQEMIDLVPKMSKPLAATVMVQEQLALALNRAQRSDEAERLLREILLARGPSSETYALLGRVYKDRWEASLAGSGSSRARGQLDSAIEAYLKGFNADIRDAYPGVNAATLMELRDPPDPRRAELFPVVTYAVKLRIAAGQPDYWDYATLVELAVLRRDRDDAVASADKALAAVREGWEPETTARNLRLIREARERRSEPEPWAEQVEQALLERAGKPDA